MNIRKLSLLCALCVSGSAFAYDMNNWPTSYTSPNGYQAKIGGNYQYDYNHFSDNPRLEKDNDGNEHFRRKEFSATFGKKDVFDATVGYDFFSKLWLDVYARMETKALFGQDLGKVRLGYLRVPVGLEGVLSSSYASFLMENSPMSQALPESRRTGADWSFERTNYAFQVGAYGGKDLQGDNPGTTQALRAVWIPIRSDTDVLHFAVSMAHETPRGYHDGRDVSFLPSVRFRARPDAALTSVRLVDTGTINHVDHMLRSGLEGLWLHGPLVVQGEALQTNVTRDNGAPSYSANGQYLLAAWTVTGESRPYSVNGLGSIQPTHAYGAVELVARYGHLNLNDHSVQGGRQDDWTVGTNWYLTNHFKLAANYSHVDASYMGTKSSPKVVELRAQVNF